MRLRTIAFLIALPALLLMFPPTGDAAAQDASSGASPEEGAPFRLADRQWENRVLLLFTPSTDDPGAQKQRRLFRATPDSAFAERDLLLVEVPAQGTSRWRDWNAPAEQQPVRRAAAMRLRERFGIDDEAFALILVGKDGTEKRRDEAPVETAALFDEIDAMPMRQREMKQQ